MLKFSHVAAALSFMLVAAAGCSTTTSGGTGTTTGTACAQACGENATCLNGQCKCYQGYEPCAPDVDAGLTGDAGGVSGDGGQSFLCVNFARDNFNCGTCGTVCGAGEDCLNSACVCDKGTSCIDDGGVTVCTDPEVDPLNCGSCNHVCPSGEQCTLGVCICKPTLTIAECATDAGEQCINLTTDNNNCGGCGNVCAGNQHCAAPGGGNGVCVCTDGGPGTANDNCGGSCTDTTRDPFNCGECGLVCVSGSCSPNDAGVGTCNCPPPYQQCGPDCVDTFTDIYHCGKCEKDCTAIGAGISELACNLGNCYCGPTSNGTICPGPTPTCARLSSDKDNCGECGNICVAPATDCINSTCSCPDGQALCGLADSGTPQYCVITTTNDQDCGTCGNVCANTYASGSGCRFGICTCSPGQTTLCADLPANGIDPTCTCAKDAKTGQTCGQPSFATDVYPLLAQQSGTFGCSASGCHTGGSPAGGLPFLDQNGNQDAGMAYAALVIGGGGGIGDGGVPVCDAGVVGNSPSLVCACVSRVTPGSHDSSYLEDVITNDLPCSAGGPMPEDADGGWLPLNACSRQLIEQWIDQGATY